jgi:hypothetical protein
MMFDETICKTAILNGNYEWRKHTVQRMAERNGLQSEVIAVILSGKMISTYDSDKPFPSALFFKYSEPTPFTCGCSYK